MEVVQLLHSESKVRAAASSRWPLRPVLGEEVEVVSTTLRALVNCGAITDECPAMSLKSTLAGSRGFAKADLSGWLSWRECGCGQSDHRCEMHRRDCQNPDTVADGLTSSKLDALAIAWS